MTREEAIKELRGFIGQLTEGCQEAIKVLVPELAESEDERIRKLLVWQVHRNIEDETNDLAGSIYDGIKGHDPDLEESIEDWKKCLAWLEKQKEPQNKSMAHEDCSWPGILTSPLCKDKNLDDIAQEYVEGVKEYNPTPDWNLIHTAVCYGYHLADQKEQKPSIEICPHSTKSKSYKENGYPIEDCDYGLEIALDILEKTVGEVQGYQTDDGIREHQTAIQAVKDVMKEQKPVEGVCSSKGRRGRIGDTPKDIRERAEKFRDGMEAPYDADDICSAYESGAMDERKKPVGWSEEDKRVIRDACCWIAEYAGFLMSENKDKAEMLWKLSEKLKSLRPQQNQEWSEEDERILKGIIGLVDHDQHYGVSNKEMIDWLKSLRPQPKQEWSEKDEDIRQSIIKNIEWERNNTPVTVDKDIRKYNEQIAWLKSLRPQPKVEWSEEAEEAKETIIAALTAANMTTDCKRQAKKWLQSLRPSWKPSEEQMKALSETIAFMPDTFKTKCTLETFQNDLMKHM